MRLLAATALVILVACGGDGGTGPGGSIAGTYQLQSIDGVSLPVPIMNPFTARGGTLTLRTDGTFTMVVRTQSGSAQGPELTWAGPYTQTGSGVALTALESPGPSGETVTGTIQGRNITVRYDLEFGTQSPDDAEAMLFTR